MADIFTLKARFSIHAPLTRGDTEKERQRNRFKSFQSTPLSRGATRLKIVTSSLMSFFNPRPSHEGRHSDFLLKSSLLTFQSTPLSRGATKALSNSGGINVFQSTPLSRGATSYGLMNLAKNIFQSTPLSRGATMLAALMIDPHFFSIHAPLTRGDFPSLTSLEYSLVFNPRPSHEGRPDIALCHILT